MEDPEDLPPLPAWLLNAPAPTVAAADTARHSPNIKLPPFQSSRPAAWFTSVQQTFHFRGVSDQKNMFTYCYVTLEEEQMQQVDDLIEMYPLLPDAFFRLRDLLVATHSPDAYQRLEQFLALPPLGGEKPSTLLTNMKQLCPPGEDATIMFWGMFLSRLPPLIRIQHAEDWVSPVHALAAHADALVTHNHGGVTAPLLKDQAPLVAAATAHGSKFPACGGKPSGGRPVAASTSAPASDKPWKKLKKFHYKLGQDCWNCVAPCSWGSENLLDRHGSMPPLPGSCCTSSISSRAGVFWLTPALPTASSLTPPPLHLWGRACWAQMALPSSAGVGRSCH